MSIENGLKREQELAHRSLGLVLVCGTELILPTGNWSVGNGVLMESGEGGNGPIRRLIPSDAVAVATFIN